MKTKFQKDVWKELEELKKLGVNVPDSAFEQVKNEQEMEDYSNMKVSACADLLIQLSD